MEEACFPRERKKISLFYIFVLGMIGASVKGHNLPCENQPITSRIAVICGTSSCHMGVSWDQNPDAMHINLSGKKITF